MSEIHRVQRLLDGHIIRASSTVQSFHNAVEELIFNSIDGSCDCVEIFVNLADGSVKIIDNGNGVSIKDMQCIGNWNYTSKSKSVSYGQKGEALAAIIQLSKQVQISSRQLSSSCSITKSFDKTESNEILISTYSNLSDSFCGTVVTVNQLFHCFPVRLRAMRPEVEMNCIKELVRHMSMLHHHINWLVVDSTNTENSFSERVVCRYAAQASVPKRFIAVHGDSVFATLTEVPAQSNGVFSVQGLMSPPLPAHCHWTKRQQYSFLNNRWLRGSDLVSVLINQLYSKTIAGAFSAGSLPKHYPGAPASDTAVHSSSNHSQQQQQQLQRIAKYPNFVLQVTCDTGEYDILSEPDKTAAMFRQPHLLVDLVVEAVRRIFEQHNPDLLPALETAIKANPHCVNVRAPVADSSPSQSDALVGGLEQGAAAAAAECSTSSPHLNSGAALYSINTHPPVSANCVSSQNLFAGLGLDDCSAEASSPQSSLFLSAFGLESAQGGQPDQQSRKQPDTDLFTPLPSDRRKVDARLTHDTYRRQNVRSAARKRKSADCSSSNIGSIVSDNVASADTLQTFDDGIFCSEYTSFYESERGATVNRAATAASGYESLMDQLLTDDSAAERATEEDHEVQCAAAADGEDECGVRANQFHHFAYSHDDNSSSDVAFAHCTGYGSYGVSGQTQQQCNIPFVCREEAGVPAEQRGSTQYAFYDAPSSNTPWTASSPCGSALMFGAVFEGDCDPIVPENYSTVSAHFWQSHDQRDSYDPSQCDQIDLYASDVVPCASPLTAVQSFSELMSRECVARESSPFDQSHPVSAIVPQLCQYVYQQQEQQEQQYLEEFVLFESRDADSQSPHESAAAAVRVAEGAATSSQQLATHVQHRRTFATSSSNSGASCNSDLFNSSTQEPGLLAVDVVPAQQPPIDDPLNSDFRSSDSMLDVESAVGELEMAGARVISDATVSLHRDNLLSARLVGQCDSRYIISTVDTQNMDGGTGKLLLAVDQHAADERVNLERLAETQQREREHSFVATNESVTICDDVRCVLEQRSDLFLSWHFEYCVSAQPSPQQTAGTGAVFVLTLLQTCTVLDEPLSIHDLLEFVHFVADGRLHFPSTLLRPPAVPRILASRACHSSVRFGDALDSTACSQLLTSLASTAYPFQCAHGRPSVVPLLDLTALLRKEDDQASKEWEEVAALLACLRKAASEKQRG